MLCDHCSSALCEVCFSRIWDFPRRFEYELNRFTIVRDFRVHDVLLHFPRALLLERNTLRVVFTINFVYMKYNRKDKL